jgi:hypothetical protein
MGASTSVTGVLPVDTQVLAAITYFSVRGRRSHSMASTVWSGSNTQVTSVQRVSSFVGPATQLLVPGS